MERADPIDVDVGTRVRVRRKQLNLTQAQLGEHLGVTFQQIQKYERGANRISASMLVRTAEKLDMSVAELVGEAPGAVADREVMSMLATNGAVELLRAFTRVSDPRIRTALLDLARSVGAR